MAAKTKGKRKWYAHDTHTGWRKDDIQSRRRKFALSGHGGDVLATARGLGALSNVTQDSETKRKSRSDSLYFYRLYRKGKILKEKKHA